MPRVGIALGSNLGDRVANIQTAGNWLREIAVPGEPVLCAPVYQTEPMLCPPGSPYFYNSVIEICYHGTPLELLKMAKAFERKLGRSPTSERNSPRTIDIDLLYFGEQTIESGELILPHPRIGERRFVLQPLADIRPDLILPGRLESIAEILESLESTEPPLVSAHV